MALIKADAPKIKNSRQKNLRDSHNSWMCLLFSAGDISQQMAVSRIVDFLRYIKLILLHKYILKDEDRTIGLMLFYKAPGSNDRWSQTMVTPQIFQTGLLASFQIFVLSHKCWISKGFLKFSPYDV